MAWILASMIVASGSGYGISRLGNQPLPRVTSVAVGAVGAGNGVASAQGMTSEGGRLILGSSLIPPTTTYFGGPNSQAACTFAPVDPETLQVGRQTACPPYPLGAHVFIKHVTAPHPFGDSGCGIYGLAAARVESNGHVIVGPRLMDYGQCSGQAPNIAYGGGDLWLYDCATGPSFNAGEVLRISATTGAVEARIALPSICKATVAASDGGFWVGPGGWFGPGGVIYHVGPHATAPIPVLHWDGPINWMIGMGDSVYADLNPGNYADPQPSKLYRFGPGSSQPVLVSSHLDASADSMIIAGNGDFYGLEPIGSGRGTNGNSDKEQLVTLDPRSGSTSVLATLGPAAPPSSFYGGWGSGWQFPPLLFSFNALYVLWNSRLYRVAA